MAKKLYPGWFRLRNTAGSVRKEKRGVLTRSRGARYRWGTSPRPVSLGWSVAKYIALTLAGVAMFFSLSDCAYQQRGYKAFGGEVLALFLPVLYYTASTTIRDAVRSLAPKHKGEDKEEGRGSGSREGLRNDRGI